MPDQNDHNDQNSQRPDEYGSLKPLADRMQDYSSLYAPGGGDCAPPPGPKLDYDSQSAYERDQRSLNSRVRALEDDLTARHNEGDLKPKLDNLESTTVEAIGRLRHRIEELEEADRAKALVIVSLRARVQRIEDNELRMLTSMDKMADVLLSHKAWIGDIKSDVKQCEAVEARFTEAMQERIEKLEERPGFLQTVLPIGMVRGGKLASVQDIDALLKAAREQTQNWAEMTSQELYGEMLREGMAPEDFEACERHQDALLYAIKVFEEQQT